MLSTKLEFQEQEDINIHVDATGAKRRPKSKPGDEIKKKCLKKISNITTTT